MSESAFEYLNSHSLLFLATSSKSGNVHIAPLFYATEGKAIFFSAADDTETSKNLKENPTAALGVADSVSDWSKARGLQIEGAVTELEGDDEAAAGALFQAKFPHLGDDALHSHYWKLSADDIRYVHNDEAGNEIYETLGTTFSREKVE